MAVLPDLVAPITVDLRLPDLSFDIIKGLEHVNYQDVTLDNPALSVPKGTWLQKTATGANAIPSGNGPEDVYPVVVGNDEYDSLATGNVTLLIGGGFLVQTQNYVAGSYTIGQDLTAKSTGIQAAGGSDAVVARVWAYDSVNSVLTYLVLNR